MTLYKPFHADLPIRCQELHEIFSSIAEEQHLEVTYTLMRLGCAFLMPFERVVNDNKLGPVEKKERSDIRKKLEIDKKFIESSYCDNDIGWTYCNPEGDEFYEGYESEKWSRNEVELGEQPTAQVLAFIRNAVAHSNLPFACDENDDRIVRIYFGSEERTRDKETGYKKLVNIM
jgi:hypothetical protein